MAGHETRVLTCQDCGENFLAWTPCAKRCPRCRPTWRLYMEDDPIGAYQERRYRKAYERNLRRVRRQREQGDAA